MGEAAAELLVPAPRLRRLSLFGNALGDAGAARLADQLAAAAHTGLLELDLAGCGIGAAGAARLFAVLEGGSAPALEVRAPQCGARSNARRLYPYGACLRAGGRLGARAGGARAAMRRKVISCKGLPMARVSRAGGFLPLISNP